MNSQTYLMVYRMKPDKTKELLELIYPYKESSNSFIHLHFLYLIRLPVSSSVGKTDLQIIILSFSSYSWLILFWPSLTPQEGVIDFR